MAGFLGNGVLDAALDYIKTEVTNLYICSAEPTTLTEANTTYKLGTKATPATGTITDGDVSGRKLPVSAISDGVVDSAGTATWLALCSGTELLATQALAASKAVVTGSPFTTQAFDIEIPDPA